MNSFKEPHSRVKCVCAWFFFLLFWWELFRGIIQFGMFHFATMGCSASGLENYRYPGGDWTCSEQALDRASHLSYEHWSEAGPGCRYSPEDNVVPANELLLEQPSTMMGKPFAVFPATAGAATIDRAQVGQWWRTWGPWFNTYTYQDMHGRSSIYMRPTIMGMMGLYSETRIMRCDGGGDVWYFGEGSNWVSNRIRTFFGNIFGLQREGSFKIYNGTVQFGTALETFHGQKSITFQQGTGENQNTLGSAVLTANSDHPNSDMWSMHGEERADYTHFPPYYVMSAASTLMAFRWISVRQSRGLSGGTSGRAPPSFLAQTSNANVTFFEESEEDVHQDPEPQKNGGADADTETGDALGKKV
jgi:hypothetical protein